MARWLLTFLFLLVLLVATNWFVCFLIQYVKYKFEATYFRDSFSITTVPFFFYHRLLVIVDLSETQVHVARRCCRRRRR